MPCCSLTKLLENMAVSQCASVLTLLSIIGATLAFYPYRPPNCGPYPSRAESCRDAIEDLKVLLELTQNLQSNQSYICPQCNSQFSEELILKLINALVFTATNNCGYNGGSNTGGGSGNTGGISGGSQNPGGLIGGGNTLGIIGGGINPGIAIGGGNSGPIGGGSNAGSSSSGASNGGGSYTGSSSSSGSGSGNTGGISGGENNPGGLIGGGNVLGVIGGGVNPGVVVGGGNTGPIGGGSNSGGNAMSEVTDAVNAGGLLNQVVPIIGS